MRVICENGFYKFYPQEIADIARFEAKYGVDLVECEDYFTFEVLAALPNFSFQGQLYSGISPALVNYAGKREEVMAANGYCYYQKTKSLILASAISDKLVYYYDNFFIAANLPQAFSLDYESKTRITGFSGIIDVAYMRFKIERFFYESI